MELPDATACEPDNAVSCRLVYRWTEDDALASAATFLIGKPLAVVAIILIGFLARWLAHRFIARVTQRAANGTGPGGAIHGLTKGKLGRSGHRADLPASAERRVQRAETMGTLLKSIASGVIAAIVIVMVLAEVGINVAPIIASAGIVGIALGFGAQSLVSDFLAGIFMIVEDQYGVGDVVDLGDASGTVEAVSLRVTRLRDVDGTVWYVRNGEILRVGNMSQNWARAVIDVPVDYDVDLAKVRRVLQEVAHDMWDDDDFRDVILEEPSVWGMQTLDASGITMRVAVKTKPLEQWAVGRELRARIKTRFDYEDIAIPMQQLLFSRTPDPADKDGKDAGTVDAVTPSPEG
ncbi:mechanosensitive ion channel family protein [Nocardioides massiliensis]|uniref:Small conductance mechanosensitive channel n=1 Tax=Nocardioides massiliensis TaxID=1325935 RepID=A0ABT9NPH1_9ACTN|nr:mechanosensitive ion channel family protein [Nocardioides massiliensis]MDP9822321.1 small conductance mechanosensitive channel [Nocardioides massiliensis]